MGSPLATDDRPESSRMFAELRRGARLGRYELLVPVATGGMARVWAARTRGENGDTSLVAIKTILPHLAREAEFERMFVDEARIASRIHHPNVCRIYELGEEKGTEGQSVMYMAMEWVFGDSLARLLRSADTNAVEKAGDRRATEPIDLRVAARIVADAAAGLHAAHELVDESGRALGVVHRDVSPHNLLVGADGHVKVTDFGVAKALDQTHSFTVAGQIKGKIHYMAPEQVTGSAIDRRSDVFALGCVLYEATTGVTPFRGEAEHQVMHSLLKGDFVHPGKALIGYPMELEKILLRALSPSPADRFPTADAFRDALEGWIRSTGGEVGAAHVGSTVRSRLQNQLARRSEAIREANDGVGIPQAEVPPSLGGSGSGVRPGQRAAVPAPPEFRRDSVGSMSATVLATTGENQAVVPLGAIPAGTPATIPAPPPSGLTPPPPLAVTGSGVTQSNPSFTRTADLVSPRRYLVAAALGVGAAILLGILTVIAFMLVHRQGAPAPQVVATPPPTPTVVAPPPTPTGVVTPDGVISADSAQAPGTAAPSAAPTAAPTAAQTAAPTVGAAPTAAPKSDATKPKPEPTKSESPKRAPKPVAIPKNPY